MANIKLVNIILFSLSYISLTFYFPFQHSIREKQKPQIKLFAICILKLFLPVLGVFENVASSYDLMNDAMSFGVHRLWKDYFVSVLNPTPDMKLLDVAGGTGETKTLL